MNKRLQVLGGFAALAAAGLGLVALGTWLFDTWRVAAFGADYVPMAPSTAAMFVLLGLALAVRRWMPPASWFARGFGVLAAVMAAGAAGMVLSRPWHGLASPWPEWFKVTGQYVEAIPVGEMSPLTAAAFLLAALAVASQSLVRRHSAREVCLANALGTAGLLMGIFVVAGYATGTPLGYGTEKVPMALLTAFGFIALNLGVLLSGWICPIFETWFRFEGDAVSTHLLLAYTRRLGLITAALMILIGLLGFTYLRREQTDARRQAYDQLEAIATLKAEQITRWHQERMGEARFLMHTAAVARDIAALIQHPQDPAARTAVEGWLEPIKAGDRYEAVMVYDAQAKPLLAVPATAFQDTVTPKATLLAALSGRTIRQLDLRSTAVPGQFRLNLLVPVMPPPGGLAGVDPRPIALISLRMNPSQALYPMIQSWPVPSATAESLLVRREGNEVVFLNDLRHQRGAALSLRWSVEDRLLPAARIVRGETGVQEGRDYRGVKVLAVGRPLPGTPWHLVVKIDRAEVYAATEREFWQTGVMVLVLLFTVLLGAAFVWRRRYSGMLRRALVAEKERNEFAERLALHTRYANDIILLLDENWHIIEANERALEVYGYSLEELRELPPGGLRAPSAQADHTLQVQAFYQPEGACFETVHQRKDGSLFPVEISGRMIKPGEQERMLAVIRDISRRKADEAEIERLTRVYAALSQVNQAIVHAKSREGLLQEICRVLVEFGHFKVAWIGWLDPAGGRVVPAAIQGDEFGQLKGIQVRGDDTPQGRGPVGRAIREQRTQVCNDYLADPTTAPWHALAEKAGIRASIALPIKLGDQSIGALAVYATDRGVFGPKEIALLEEAAMDIAFGLDGLERERQRERAERALQASEARFRTIFDHAPVGISLTMESGEVMANAEHARITGVPVERSSEPGIFGRVSHPDDYARQIQLADRFHRGEIGHFTVQKRYWHPDGRVQWAELTSRFYRDPETKQRVIVTTLVDIAERKQAEEALRDSEQRYHTFINATSDLIFLKDAELRYVISNRANNDFLGKDEAEVVGHTDFDFMPREAAERCRSSDQQALAAGQVVVSEEMVKGRTYQTIKFPVPLPGDRTGVGGFIHDVTESRLAAEALRLSEEKYRTIFEESFDGLFITSPEGRILDMNKRGIAMFGYETKEEVLNLDLVRDVYAHPPDRQRILTLVNTQGVAEYDVEVKRKDGTHLITHCALTAVKDETGRIGSYRGIIRDITASKRAEEALIASELRLRRAITDAPFPIMLHAEDGTVLHLSNVWCEITGYDRQEIATIADWTRLAYREARSTVQSGIDALYELKRHKPEGDFVVHTKGGDIRTWSFSSAPLGRLPDGRRVVISMAMDVTERRNAEEALRASQQLIEGIINAIPVRVFWKDRNLVYLGCNSAFALDAGFSDPRDIVGKDDTQLVWREQAEAYQADDREVIESGDPKLLIEESQTNSEGQEVTLLTNKLPLRDAQGKIYGVLGTYVDITGRKRAEKVLRTSLQEKEALLKEVHHRVKNNLQVITSLLRLESGRSEDHNTKTVLRDMQGRIRSMALLHETLYRSGTFARIDLANYLRQLATQLFRAHNTHPAGIRLNLDLALVEVDIDQAIPCALLVNELLTNALKHAFPAGRSGEVWVRLQPEEEGWVRLQISDNGVGLPPGFSVQNTKSLGLHLATDLSRQLQGELAIAAGPGAGFAVRFRPRVNGGPGTP